VVETGHNGCPQAKELVPTPLQTHAHAHVHGQAPCPANTGGDIPLQNALAEALTPGAVIETQVTRVKVKARNNCFFKKAQRRVVALPVLSVWGAMSMSTPSAPLPSCGMGGTYGSTETNRGGSSPSTASLSVSVSKPWLDVQRPSLGMEPSSALLHRKSNVLTSYIPDAWLRWLTSFNLLKRYPILYHSLIHGFDVGIHTISKTYIPPNNPSILKHPKIYNEIVENEFRKGRYLGPFSQVNLKALSSPHPSHWFPNQANQGNSMQSMTSHTHTCQTKTLSPQLILASTHTISPVPGGHS